MTWPGLPPFDLDDAQRAVVRELLTAHLHRDSPDVAAADLLLVALFAGTSAFGTLIVPGRKRGRYRLAEPTATGPTGVNPES